jgi:hypothetical protein
MLDMPMSKPLAQSKTLAALGDALMDGYKENAEKKIRDGRNRTEFSEFYPKLSKPIIDEIDREIGRTIGLTAEEIDYVINYDVRFRMGADEGDAE